MGSKGRRWLTCPTTAKQTLEDSHGGIVRNQLLQAHCHDMQVGHGCGHIRIAFIGAHNDIACFSNSKISARHPCPSFHELIAKMDTSATGQVSRIIVSNFLADPLLFEHPTHLFAFQVYGRHDNMRWLLPHQLKDALTKVGLYHVNTTLHQVSIHPYLLGKHRFALHHLGYLMGLEDTIDDLIELLCIPCPMYDYAIGFEATGEFLQVICKMSDRMPFDRTRMFSQFLPFRKFPCHHVPFGTYTPKGLVMPGGLVIILIKGISCLAM